MNFSRNTPGDIPKTDPNTPARPAARLWAGVGDSASPPVAQGGYSLNFYTPLVAASGPISGGPNR